MQPSQDWIDKNNPQYTFIPEIEHTTQQIEANKKLAEILNDPNLTESEQREACWSVLNS
ncbi:hypothetical protein [Nodularia sp. NIES-3585]|uniref:hypothetical protein n=1 Tax=Nodularia sp. NIES-3585 TaxID=1973477 RepID=UPI000B702B3C|nr:hypothetical protein [Nodularia sp. NIES-3585]GAX38917.1 hypothetical protein NIES3585_49690 [Nodularia sp. NIES-3585]